MNFTNEDLKRLKQHIDDEDYNIITVSSDKLEALIARMECAERYAWAQDKANGPVDKAFLAEAKEAWLRSKGSK